MHLYERNMTVLLNIEKSPRAPATGFAPSSGRNPATCCLSPHACPSIMEGIALMPLNSARQLAELSGIGESTLAEWRGTHTGPAYVKSGRRVLYPKEAVLGFMRANLRECKEASA